MINPKKRIDQRAGQLQVALQDSNNNNIKIISNPKDHIEELLKSGKLKDAAEYLGDIHKLYQQAHPLWPFYIYKPVSYGNKTVLDHKPVNKQASNEYPLMYKGTFTIDVKKYGETLSFNELIRKATARQEEIQMNIKYIETWIGNTKIDDEGTLVREAVKDGSWVIIPRELPPPIKIKVVKENETILDYIELNLSDIEKEYIVLDNSKQETSKFLVTLRIDKHAFINDNEQNDGLLNVNTKFNLSIKEGHQGNILANYKILHFILGTLKNQNMSFVNLETGGNFAVVNNYSAENKESISDIERDLELIKDLMAIEKHFNIEFVLPEKIEKDDYECIDILLSVLRNKERKGKFNDLILDYSQKDGLQDLIKKAENLDKLLFKMNTEIKVELFDQTVTDIIQEDTLDNLIIEDVEKVKRKLSDMEDGETIKVKLIPNSNNQITTVYKWPAALQ
jgi:hypothetical protein